MAPAHWSLKLCRWKALSGGGGAIIGTTPRLRGPGDPPPRLPIRRRPLCPQAVCRDGHGVRLLSGRTPLPSDKAPGVRLAGGLRAHKLTPPLASQAVAWVPVPGSVSQAVRNEPCGWGGAAACLPASACLSRLRLEFRTGWASWVYLDGSLPSLSSTWSCWGRTSGPSSLGRDCPVNAAGQRPCPQAPHSCPLRSRVRPTRLPAGRPRTQLSLQPVTAAASQRPPR